MVDISRKVCGGVRGWQTYCRRDKDFWEIAGEEGGNSSVKHPATIKGDWSSWTVNHQGKNN